MAATKSAAKNDIQRIGLFSEVGYITIGDPYRDTRARAFNVNAGRGKQMMTSSTKAKSGLCDGYFQSNFGRVFEKEGHTDPIKARRIERISQARKNIVKRAFYPSNNTKKPCGLGSHYGTFQGNVEYFKGITRAKEAYKSPGKNFLTNPTKKGSGYGYTSLTIGRDFEYISEFIGRPDELRALEKEEHKKRLITKVPFKPNEHNNDLFDPNIFKLDKPLPPVRNPRSPVFDPKYKKIINPPFKPSSPAKNTGNCKAGTFTPYPEHPVDGFELRGPKPPGPKYGMFIPSVGNKSRPTDSVIRMHVKKRTTKTNFRTAGCSF